MYLFMINRNAGNGNGYRTWLKVRENLDQRAISYKHIYTTNSEEAVQLLTNLLSTQAGWQAVTVIGGDGTIHSVLPALRHYQIPLGIIPAGSGNDTARAFGIPMSCIAALDIVLSGQRQRSDLISTAGIYTLTALAIGFDAAVANNVNLSLYKKICNFLRMGRLAYIIGVLHTLMTFKPGKATITCDGHTAVYEGTWMTAITNSSSYGGGLVICPQAKHNDGLLDVCVVQGCSRWQLLRLFPTVITGKHVNLSFVKMLRGREITVNFDDHRLALGDGENISSLPYSASVDQDALHVLSPLQAS